MRRTERLVSLLAAVAVMTGFAVEATAQTAGPTPVEATPAPAPPGVPVVFAGETLFTLASRVGAFSPEERAAALVARLDGISRDPFLKDPKLTVSPVDDGAVILLGDRALAAVTAEDARAAGSSPEEAATAFADAIGRAIARSHQHFSLRSLAVGALLTLLATVVLVLLLKLIARLFPALIRFVGSLKGTVIRSVRIQKLELLTADRITAFAVFLVKLTHVSSVVVLLYFYIPLVFGFFPWTRGLSRTLFGYTLTPLRAAWSGFLATLPNLFFLGVIAVLTHYGIRLVKVVFTEIERGTVTLPGFEKDWAQPTYKIVRFLVLVFAAIVAFPYLPGSESPAFKGISLFLGLLFSLGSSSAIANVVAGVILTYTGAFKLGDRVKIADTVGDVVEKTLLVTRVQTVKHVEVTIPNSMVLGSHIVNYSTAAATTGILLHTKVTIGYDAPWRQVHALLIGAALKTDGVLPEPAPFVLQLSLDDYYPSYELNATTREPWRMSRIYSDLHANIQDAFNQAGVEIMSPAYHALRDGNPVTIPAESLPEGYEAPAFRVVRVDPPSGRSSDGSG